MYLHTHAHPLTIESMMHIQSVFQYPCLILTDHTRALSQYCIILWLMADAYEGMTMLLCKVYAKEVKDIGS